MHDVLAALGDACALLTAKSFGEHHIPKDFRLMFWLPSPDHPQLGDELLARHLKGVSGLSDSGQVLMLRMLAQNRNAMLIMRGSQVVALNKLSRVMYENPDYLVANDLAALQRIYGGSTDKSAAVNRVFQAMDKVPLPYAKTLLRRYNDRPGYTADQIDKPINTVRDFARQWMALNAPIAAQAAKDNVQDPETFNPDPSTWDEWLQERYGVALKLENYVELLRAGLTLIGRDFGWEGEWLVKNRTLVIPPKSRLVLAGQGPRLEEQKAFVAEHRLAEVYDVTVASAAKLEQATMRVGMESAKRLTKRRYG